MSVMSQIDADAKEAQSVAGIGHNGAPESTPFDRVKSRIDDLFLEANNFLDGEKIMTAQAAAPVEKLKGDLLAAVKAADEERKAENKPFDDGKAEVQARYNLLIGETKAITGTAILALEACKKALTPWLVEQQRIKDEEAQKARDEAERLRLAAQAARETVDASNLADKQAADALAKEAEKASKTAKRAMKAVDTKTGLRITYSAEIVDLQALSRHVWARDPDGARRMMQGWADSTVSAFGSNAAGLVIPGVVIHAKKEAR